MSSILIFGSTKAKRKEKITQLLDLLKLSDAPNNPDLLKIDTLEKKKSIGIDQARGAIKFINEKPLSNQTKALVIERAHLLTIPAQNSLLKTLEEHPSFSHIILGVRSEDQLLTTIISRCKKVDTRTDIYIKEKNDGEFEKLKNTPVGNRFIWAEENSKKEKDEVVETLDLWISELRQNMNAENVSNIELISKVRKDIEKSNLTLKLALEYLILHIK